MRNLTEPLWNFSSAPCERCLTRSLKLPRPAARVTPELCFFRAPAISPGCSVQRDRSGWPYFQSMPLEGAAPAGRHSMRLRKIAPLLALLSLAAAPLIAGECEGRSPHGCKNQFLGERVENCAHGNALALQDGGNDQAIQRGARTIPQRASKSKSLIGRSQ